MFTDDHQQNIERFHTPDWADWMDFENVSQMLPDQGLTDWKFHGIASAIETVRSQRLLPPNIRRIFEFGSGSGSGLVVLNRFVALVGGESVVGSERTPGGARILERMYQPLLELLPSVSGIEWDGIRHLSTSKSEYDLVFANMFGPSYFNDNEELGRGFLGVVLDSLTPEGVAILNSDEETMHAMQVFAADILPIDQFTMVDSRHFHGPNRDLPHMAIGRNLPE